MTSPLGIIGGSGLYGMAGVKVLERHVVETPFGAPSAPLVQGELEGRPVVFLARHGEGHTLLPSEVNYRANLWALKFLGVRRVVSVSAVGSLQERHVPGTLRLPDQFVDRTHGRPSTFFGQGLVAHVGYADPTCPALRARLLAAGRGLGLPIEDGGTYVCMEGPAFSTRAESRLHQGWGADYIGMTQATEARLAREAELCFATLALVTDYDAWREHDGGVETADILAVIHGNIEKAQALLRAFAVDAEPWDGPACACGEALKTAFMTAPGHVPDETRRRLGLLVEKYGY